MLNSATNHLFSKTRLAAVLSLACSLLLFLDYIWPGSFHQTTISAYIVDVPQGRPTSGTTYNIKTLSFLFPVAPEFNSNRGDSINLEVSPVLKIVNSYWLPGEKTPHTYYTRYLSGIFIPLGLLLIALITLLVKNIPKNYSYILLAINVLAIFFTLMTVLNTANIF